MLARIIITLSIFKVCYGYVLSRSVHRHSLFFLTKSKYYGCLHLQTLPSPGNLMSTIQSTSEVDDSVRLAPILDLTKLVTRGTWIAWWTQIILTVISTVILTFAKTVSKVGTSNQAFWSSGFAFSIIGVIVSFVNTFWTWNITRLCRRIQFSKIDLGSIIPTFRRYFHISVGLSLIGMFITLIGAEQIVGTLASKVLSISGTFQPYAIPSATGVTTLQALDIFLVQANTNTIVAHFAPLVCSVLLQTQLPLQLIRVKEKVTDQSNGNFTKLNNLVN